MEYRTVYITASSKDEARKIGRELVAGRLAACINILDGMNSMYWWDGQIQDDQEAVLLAKTTRERVAELIDKVRQLHSYDTPCVVTWPILEGNPDYLTWIQDETRRLGEK